MLVAIYQENGNAAAKIAGIRRYGRGIDLVLAADVTGPLPGFIDDPAGFIPPPPEADIVLSFLKHPDLAAFLADLCAARAIPLVASGKKLENAICPFTCCSLGRRDDLGAYGEQFGFPEFRVRVEGGRLVEVEVVRGASCGATWEAAAAVAGMPPAEALPLVAREAQYLCVADPSAFDPVSGKSALHHAGHVHAAGLRKALAAVGVIVPEDGR